VLCERTKHIMIAAPTFVTNILVFGVCTSSKDLGR
jgi:hypothetical protein